MGEPTSRAEIEHPSTWSVTYVPFGTTLHHEIETGPGSEEPEIRLMIGEPEIAELAMEPRVAAQVVAIIQQAIGACEATSRIRRRV